MQVVHVHVAVAVNLNVHEQIERDGQMVSHPDFGALHPLRPPPVDPPAVFSYPERDGG